MKRIVISLLLCVSFGLLGGFSGAQAATPLTTFSNYIPLMDEFSSAIVMVPKTHQILYSFKPDQAHPAASLTKLSNALAFLKRGVPMSKTATLLSKDEVGGGRLRVTSGSKMSVQDMFFSTITASANNTAMALGRLSGLSKSAYLSSMNQQAKLAGATHSKFVDFAGMDPLNMTTAKDMALIADTAFSNPTIRRAASSMRYAFTVTSGKTKIAKTLTNTNDLLTKDPEMWVIGGKTGYLEESKNNLAVRLRELDSHGTPIAGTDVIVVVFGVETKEAMFASAKRLANWSWQNHAF